MKTFIIRWFRIIKHSLFLMTTIKVKHSYEIQHYFYMKEFRV